jgi:hypothetical protein
VNELEIFLREAESILEVSGIVTEYGVGRTLHFEIDQRHVEISTNGPMLWFVADVRWPDFPADGTSISWAPEGSLLRIKLLEGPTTHCVTGLADFDSEFIIQGHSAERLRGTPREALEIFVANARLRPHLTGREIWLEPPPIRRRPHVRCDPDLSEDPGRAAMASLGTELFTPPNAARWAIETATFVESLERAVGTA